LAYLARTELADGDVPTAMATIEEAIAEPTEDVRAQLAAMCVYIEVLIAADRRPEAATVARDALERASEAGYDAFADEAERLLALADGVDRD
jgi:hypothetical protein